MNDKHLNKDKANEKSQHFFSNGKINWEKSEADVWAELQSKMDKKPKSKSISLFSKVAKIAAAAIIAVLVGLSAVTFLYTKTIESVSGKQKIALLPDGSAVELNAESTLRYYPLKWKFDRKLFFEGEGYFKVMKGRKFEVVSASGITRVLGTSFNIYARDTSYRVTCLTGKVNVVSNENQSVILTPNKHVEIENGKLVMKTKYKTERAISWKNNQFDFAGRPLIEVVEEIERQYNITIQLPVNLNNRSFGGNFSKTDNVEDVLDLICRSMQLKYEKRSKNVFLIVKQS